MRVVPEVKNVPVVEVTPVTTCCDVGVPLTTGTVSTVRVPPGGLPSIKMLPLFGVVVLPLELKVYFVPVGLLAGSNAGTKRLVGRPGVGVMPVTVPVVAVTPVTAVPVA